MEKSTEKLMATSGSMSMSVSTDPGGIDNLNYVSSTNSENPDYAEIKDHEVPNFVLGPFRNQNNRPISMYEPWAESKNGYNSLPPDLLGGRHNMGLVDIDIDPKLAYKTSWEAEDASEFITTLDESAILDIASLENVNQNPIYSQPHQVIVAADIHHNHHQSHHHQSDLDERKYEEIQIYATIKKKPKEKKEISDYQVMVTSGGPVEKYPKIMTTSCYGELNAWTEHQSAIVRSSECLINSQINSMNNSIIDEYASINGSLYEPNSMNSSFEVVKYSTNERMRVKWWDELTEETEAEVKEMAEKGKVYNYQLFLS